MGIKREEHSVYFEDSNGKKLAFVLFPFCGDNIVNINHTYVDDSLRGQGFAKALMDEAIEVIKEKNYSVKLTCSYAMSYFAKHPELLYLLVE